MEQFTTRNLPISIQSFADIRERKCVYVDKTQFIPPLLSTGKQYFLSRPRRFGKSLFISMLKAYFLGKKDLFAGLAIEKLETEFAVFQKREPWICRPVFHLDLGGQIYTTKEALENIIKKHLDIWEKEIGTSSNSDGIAMRFRDLIRTAAQTTGQKAVVLIDEYDKPLLDNIYNEELLEHYRTILKGFYGTLKPLDEYLHFVFITGITRFDKVSIFSDFNQLYDISTSEKFSSVCGITQSELEQNFQPEIKVMAEKYRMTYDECLAKLKQKYDGYHFSSESENIYNPFSMIYTFDERKFGNYWFETATPTFLVKMLRNMNVDAIKLEKGFAVAQDIFESYHIDTSTPEPILYQAGYLTITGYRTNPDAYTLAFPNDEVKYSFLNMLLPYYIDEKNPGSKKMEVWHLYEEISAGEVDSFMERIQAIVAGLPQKTSEKIYELDFKVVFYLIFKLLGQFIQCEVQSVKGRADAVVWTEKIIYVFEFKLNSTVEDALAQIDDRGYAIPYQSDGRKIVKIGATFSNTEKNISEWKSVIAN